MECFFSGCKNLSKEDSPMKIVHCPKGGKMPVGYCNKSCLNYCMGREKNKGASSKKEKQEIRHLNFKSVRVDNRKGYYKPQEEPSPATKIVFSFN